MLFKGGACSEGKWGGHGHAMGAPRPGLRGTVGKTYAVGRRGMGHACCPQSGASNVQAHPVSARQHTSVCRQRRVAHMQRKAAPRRVQAAQGNAQAA